MFIGDVWGRKTGALFFFQELETCNGDDRSTNDNRKTFQGCDVGSPSRPLLLLPARVSGNRPPVPFLSMDNSPYVFRALFLVFSPIFEFLKNRGKHANSESRIERIQNASTSSFRTVVCFWFQLIGLFVFLIVRRTKSEFLNDGCRHLAENCNGTRNPAGPDAEEDFKSHFLRLR